MSPKVKPQIIQTVASMYVSAAVKRVSGHSAGQNNNSQCVCDKLYSGHALRVQAPQVFDGIWCISPRFKPQIIQTVASMYVSAAGQRVSWNLAGQNDHSQCICDQLNGKHAVWEQVPQVVDGIWCISPKFITKIIKTVASMYVSAAGKRVSGISAGQNDHNQCI